MNVCDHCKNGMVVETIKINKKSYDICSACLNRIVSFLETHPKTIGDKLGDLFK